MKTMLVVDDDKVFCNLLAKAMVAKDYEVRTANSVTEAVAIAADFNPEYVIADLKMPGATGLELIPKLLEIDQQTQIVVLTGYANFNTAVEAIKLGAIHYLAKPVSADEIIEAFSKKQGDPNMAVDAEAVPLNRAEWEHINKVLKVNHNNISATARELGMHRRTLQRKLEKMPAKYKI